ncbi:response regulator [Chromobacterium alticapitis]|uniref:Two-component system response regulator n=1 Tax=Chromobacterium alticapitis TaxID=2073169 RepID=A0A2S5DG20_9NEIS|nr:two-component system response regulator [Chromobacterium alticapitis]POZ61957.1 two-component system response regulator [Chromobacterium alticapitis]
MSAESATVLIVDDAPECLSVLGELLQPHYRVRVANSGPTALRLAAAGPPPDLVLLDMMMPGMDGRATFARLRADPATAEVPVIFVTAMSEIKDELSGLEAGAVDYITKPIVPQLVLARVRIQLELKLARDRLNVQNRWLEREVARRMEENDLTQRVAIHALARLAEMRDMETGNHLLRTQGYVQLLGRLLQRDPSFRPQLSDYDIDLMARSAPLHDIGKVGIPDRILLKPGKLDAAEWDIMRTHARLGEEAIAQAERDAGRPLDFLACAKDVAGHHHERWDGKGYPDGLAGEAIPLSARLMALADVFDALISCRCYKPALAFEAARGLIEAGRGSQFQPELVDAFLAHFDDFVAIALCYADKVEGVEG